jgi:predicted adenylyl cyclase CyaB
MELGVEYIRTVQQRDTYYKSPQGRLKLREIKKGNTAELIFYERKNHAGPKQSKVIILKIQEAKPFKHFFQKALTTTVVIEKKREIYLYKGTQIHLDSVKDLGTFIEFERETTDSVNDRKRLDNLITILEIQDKDLIKYSYSDLIVTTNEGNK